MQKGDRVKHKSKERIGICRGPIFHFSVWWMIVDWDDGTSAYVLEECLEVINEGG